MALYLWFLSVLTCPAINISSFPFSSQQYKYLLHISPHSFSTCIVLTYSIKSFHSYLFTTIYSFLSELLFSACRVSAMHSLTYTFLVPSCLDTVQGWYSNNTNVWFRRRITFNTDLKFEAILSFDKTKLRNTTDLLVPFAFTVHDVWALPSPAA